MNTTHIIKSLLLALLLSALSGCATNETQEPGDQAVRDATGPFGDYQAKNFLSDYSGFEPQGEDGETFLYRDHSVDLSRYNKVMIDRIKIFFKEEAEYKGIDPTELKALVDYFHEAIIKEVSGSYPVVDEPGPDVLRLRIAVTDLVPNKPEASVVTLVVPFLWIGDAGAGVAEGNPGSTLFVGEATMELEALDSESSERIVGYIETRIGKKYHWNDGVGTAVTDYAKAYSTWAYTKQAMEFWAQLIRERLDAAHGKAPEKEGA